MSGARTNYESMPTPPSAFACLRTPPPSPILSERPSQVMNETRELMLDNGERLRALNARLGALAKRLACEGPS